MLVSASSDGSVKFWHVANGQELLNIPYPGRDAVHLEFTRDGKQLIYQFSTLGEEHSNRLVVLDGSTISP